MLVGPLLPFVFVLALAFALAFPPASSLTLGCAKLGELFALLLKALILACSCRLFGLTGGILRGRRKFNT